MRTILVLVLAASGGLSACTGTAISIGGGGSGSNAPPEYADSTADTFTSKVTDGGVTGTMASLSALGTLSDSDEINIELSPDYQTAFLILNGQRIRLEAQGTPGTSQGGLFTDGTRSVSLVGSATGYTGTMYYNTNAGTVGLAVLGAETRPGDMPGNATARYEGLYQFVSAGLNTVGGTGFTNIDVDFGTGDVGGTFNDGVASTDVFGTVEGTVSGNGFDGELTLDDPGLSGTVALDGTFYGPAAEEVGGTMDGTVDLGTGGSAQIIGIFNGER